MPLSLRHTAASQWITLLGSLTADIIMRRYCTYITGWYGDLEVFFWHVPADNCRCYNDWLIHHNRGNLLAIIIMSQTTLHQFLRSILRHTHLNCDHTTQHITCQHSRPKQLYPEQPYLCYKLPLYHTLMIPIYKLCCRRNSDLPWARRSGDQMP